MSLSNLTTVQAYIAVRAYLNPQGPSQQNVGNPYNTSNSFTAQSGCTLPVITVPAMTLNQLIDLPTLLASYTKPLYVVLQDVTSPGVGFQWGLDGSSTPQTVGPSGVFAWTPDGVTALGSIYVSNPTTSDVQIQIGAMSN